MAELLIVYHSQSGTCAKLAGAAAAAAEEEQGIAVTVLRAWDAGALDLARADGLLLIVAENSGSLAGGMKDFLDRSLYPSLDRRLVLPVAVLVSAGNDGRAAESQIERILRGFSFPLATETRILRGEFSARHADVAGELGGALAAGLVMGIF